MARVRKLLSTDRSVKTDLISPSRSLPGVLLEAGDGLVEPVRLGLERLHLLPDGVHGEAVLLCELVGRDRLHPESRIGVRTTEGMRFHSNWREFTQNN